MDVKNTHSVTKTEISVFGRQALDAERRRSPSLADKVLRLCMCVAPPIEYTWCQFKMTSLKCPYLSKPQVIILTVHIYRHETLHITQNNASYLPAHEYTSSQILHIYGISVVICGGLPTRQAASKSPQTTTETS